jgi:hypothetical protein
MYYFRVSFKDGRDCIYNDQLTKRQAVLRYNRWVHEMGVLPIEEVAWGLM